MQKFFAALLIAVLIVVGLLPPAGVDAQEESWIFAELVYNPQKIQMMATPTVLNRGGLVTFSKSAPENCMVLRELPRGGIQLSFSPQSSSQPQWPWYKLFVPGVSTFQTRQYCALPGRFLALPLEDGRSVLPLVEPDLSVTWFVTEDPVSAIPGASQVLHSTVAYPSVSEIGWGRQCVLEEGKEVVCEPQPSPNLGLLDFRTLSVLPFGVVGNELEYIKGLMGDGVNRGFVYTPLPSMLYHQQPISSSPTTWLSSCPGLYNPVTTKAMVWEAKVVVSGAALQLWVRSVFLKRDWRGGLVFDPALSSCMQIHPGFGASGGWSRALNILNTLPAEQREALRDKDSNRNLFLRASPQPAYAQVFATVLNGVSENREVVVLALILVGVGAVALGPEILIFALAVP